MAKKEIPTELFHALGQPIELGKAYGYSTSSSGWTRTVVGKAVRFTASGQVTLEIIRVQRFLYGEPTDFDPGSAQQISIRPHMIFPVEVGCLPLKK